MEKVLWVVFVFTLILVDANRQATAAETNVNATDTNNHGANFDTNKAVIVGQEKKGANLDKTSKKNENGSLNGTRDELLEEPKSTNYSGNPSLDNATDPKTLSLADFHLEGCDPSDSCINEKDMFVACLRVPGEDSLHLSLLIQNKGTKTLDVKIVAPDFVHPKDTSVILKPKLNWEHLSCCSYLCRSCLVIHRNRQHHVDELDGWDNSWGDGWDDEAPKTPSKPVSTPSFKGLASRKSNKDGWND